jgi:hypothetical protein
MGEYEDRYPEAYGHNEDTEPRGRHFLGWGLSRQVRGAPAAEQRPQPAPAPPAKARPAAAPAAPETKADLVRTPREICDDIWEQLNQSPFIDASRVTVSVDGSEVTLDGTINSLIAISLAQSLAANVAGVTRVQVRLRLTQPPHG